MPFTFAHPAVVLPLKQAKPKWFSLSGLVAGSMAPDFEYFLKLHATSTVSETLAGIFTFNLPMAFGICLLFHQVVRNPLIKHLPTPYDKRFSGFLNFNFLQYLGRHPLRFLSSALIGIVSHLLLDFLTSPDSMTRSFHKLQQITWTSQLPHLQAISGAQSFILLERSLSLIGLVFIGWVLTQVNCPADHFPQQHPQQKGRFFTVFAVVIVLGVLASVQLLPYQLSAGQLMVNFISAAMLSLVFTALIFRK